MAHHITHQWKLFGHLLAFCRHSIKKNTRQMNSVLAQLDTVVSLVFNSVDTVN